MIDTDAVADDGNEVSSSQSPRGRCYTPPNQL